jgi:hypothetical protein
MMCEKAELFSTTRDRKCKFEVLEGFPVFKDLHGHPVLRMYGCHVGITLSPETCPEILFFYLLSKFVYY